MIQVHPTAVVSPRAKLAEGVVVGPFCLVDDDVEIGEGTRLVGSCVVLGPTRMGEHNVVYPFAVLGAEPQDRSHAGEATSVQIGDRNVIREHATVHRGTAKGRGATEIGSDCLLMVGVHVAHDVSISDAVTLANDTLLAGHVTLESRVTSGGRAAIAQFVRVGEGAFVAAGAMVETDVPPFAIVAGDRARVRALNRVGLRRSGVPDASRRALAQAFRVLFRHSVPRSVSLRDLDRELADDPYVRKLVGFLERSSPA